MATLHEILRVLSTQAAERHRRQEASLPVLTAMAAGAIRQHLQSRATDLDELVATLGIPVRTTPVAERAASACSTTFQLATRASLRVSKERANLLEQISRSCAA